MRLLAALLLLASGLAAQERDFLTSEEVDLVRLAQEPDERLKLYAGFARDRVGQIKQLMAAEKRGRSKFVHQLLEDYVKIIEAIDTVTDDALKRKQPVATGMKIVADTEKELGQALRGVRDAEPKDIARYQFALDQAIEATEDSYELAQQDLSERAREVIEKDAEERKERDAIRRPEEVKARDEFEKKEEDAKKKRPTLRKPGETAPAKPRF